MAIRSILTVGNSTNTETNLSIIARHRKIILDYGTCTYARNE